MKLNKIPLDWTPVDPIVVTIKRRALSSLQADRKQFPFVLAYALTIHKCQGLTLNQVVFLYNSNLRRDLVYVAMSRTTSVQDLYIVGKFIRPKPISENDNLEIEKRRWSKKRLLPKFKFLRTLTDSSTRIFYHNIQSFKKHKKLVQNDDTYCAANVLIFSETWSLRGPSCEIPRFYNLCP